MLQRYLRLYLRAIHFYLETTIYLPKAGHFGKPAQPYAAESLAWLRKRILGRKVYVQLLRRDQYSRIVSV
jgi:endonuclease YncB( thermonuclease family)